MAAVAVSIAAAIAATMGAASPANAAGTRGSATSLATTRIQHLLDSPVHGKVDLPSGTFTIRPDLQLSRGVQIIGHNTTLKVAAGSGNYRAVLSGATPTTNLSGLSISGVTFDQNTAHNPVRQSSALFHGQPRWVIVVVAGSGISIHGNSFTGTDGLNSIVTGGATRDVTITGNTFSVSNAHGHDHSTIYTSGTGTAIVYNSFHGTGLFDSAAIETHGSHATIKGNRISGYYRGANIVSSYTTFSGNEVRAAGNPVALWSVQAPGLTHVTVAGNLLARNLPYWKQVYAHFGASLPPAKYRQMVIRNPTSKYPFHDIVVKGNRG
jgi:hypothetical protein